MASLQLKNGSYYCQFYYQGKRHTVTVGPVGIAEAQAFGGHIDLLLLRLKQRLLTLPPGVDIDAFVLCGGKVPEHAPAVAAEPTSFRRFKEHYLETHRGGAMEPNSLATVAMHLGHFEKTLSERFPLHELTAADLQRHINRRRQKKYRGRALSPVTLKKEMASFRAAWNWAVHMGLVKGIFPSKGLVYPKADEKLPFMTWTEIERKISPGTLDNHQAELWDCLYLTQPELEELLAFVRQEATHGWIYPALAFAAHTGARRSELLRVLVTDVDFEGLTVLIREKKRSRKQRTTRRVPLTPFLARLLREWLTNHPGGEYLFCQPEVVCRSKKRSKTTGHQWSGKKTTRATSLKGRMATVTARGQSGLLPLTRDEAHDHLRRTLAGSKWEVLRGFHVLRHSFISLCASRGVDQRLIDEWVGHQTEEQRKRYRHLLPSTQQEAISSVFGDS
jgi:integrase